ncbi:fumarylacetoacetate hydrolase family protein [Croceicoccus marinus]|jgi:fumarylacetoacetate (FAA) hydrolase|uniref:Fumarylacetoacetate hydrolase family protein n=1 Tax=Croceicoccus marinus TaxID=450378 RepID=A0A7G6W016_9SPHN|nr:fumarylacetoacetate hydrolase family protein [Croceicoccus marinus]QNE07331.1 fumarylacetoacetate hydrolase family protein [Croceicoccus marinus]
MILATIKDGTRDGRLVAVSPDRKRYAPLSAGTLQHAIENWSETAAEVAALADFPEVIDAALLSAPLPRAWQWLDGSVFATHAELMQVAFGLDPIDTDRPLMYQGMSDVFHGAYDDIVLPSEEHGIDFEGEYAVITDFVPMGTSAQDAMKHIRLVVQLNDWSLRAIAPIEMKTGFGWVQAKPACSMAPFAITPDELGPLWDDGRVCVDLHIDWNGNHVGHANGRPMLFGFHELIAHAALTRDLVAGTVIGSGTVSNPNYAEVGSSCISEIRAIEKVANGEFTTEFMKFGDRIRMEARLPDGTAPFGVIDQKVTGDVRNQ